MQRVCALWKTPGLSLVKNCSMNHLKNRWIVISCLFFVVVVLRWMNVSRSSWRSCNSPVLLPLRTRAWRRPSCSTWSVRSTLRPTAARWTCRRTSCVATWSTWSSTSPASTGELTHLTSSRPPSCGRQLSPKTDSCLQWKQFKWNACEIWREPAWGEWIFNPLTA